MGRLKSYVALRTFAGINPIIETSQRPLILSAPTTSKPAPGAQYDLVSINLDAEDQILDQGQHAE
jgi:hypothetical protein